MSSRLGCLVVHVDGHEFTVDGGVSVAVRETGLAGERCQLVAHRYPTGAGGAVRAHDAPSPALVADDDVDDALGELVALIGPHLVCPAEQHRTEPAIPLGVRPQTPHTCDDVAGPNRHAVLRFDAAVEPN